MSAFSVVLCCNVWEGSPRASTSRDNKSRTYKRKSSIHTPVSANVARFPANSILNISLWPAVSPSLSACSPPSQARTSGVWRAPDRPTKLQRVQPGGTQNHAA